MPRPFGSRFCRRTTAAYLYVAFPEIQILCTCPVLFSGERSNRVRLPESVFSQVSASLLVAMSTRNFTYLYNGETLTGKLWRKSDSVFTELPFYTEIPRMDEMAGPLQGALGDGSQEGCFRAMLVVR